MVPKIAETTPAVALTRALARGGGQQHRYTGGVGGLVRDKFCVKKCSTANCGAIFPALAFCRQDFHAPLMCNTWSFGAQRCSHKPHAFYAPVQWCGFMSCPLSVMDAPAKGSEAGAGLVLA